MTAPTVTLADVEAAARRLEGRVVRTPCLHSRTLSAIVGCEVWLKFENLQFTASFKERGALNRLAQLTDAERARGVLAVSAGNHAQGVALHAQRLGIPATIVMPRFTPSVKVEATRAFGPRIVLEGDTLEDARAHGLALARDEGLVFVHPYEDPAVIAGQGTIALEMLDEVPELDTLVIAVGGGGLVAGIAVAAHGRRPGLEVIGVQTERYPAMYDAFHGTVHPQGTGTIAEGIAVGLPGDINVRLARELVADVVLVTEGEIEHAIVALLEIEKTVAEGAGAAGLAALLTDRARFAGRRVGLVLCGGNIDPLLLAAIVRREMVRSGRLARLRIEIRDRPGALAAITTELARAGANIEEIQHQRIFGAMSAERAAVEVIVQTRGEAHVAEILAGLEVAGLPAVRF
ncbi:MAG: threonine ammonia-lyase [Burkholderiaceae bacterium]|jgi:threonine dehydratase|nr:threonine ammonia-lyase [Burkholderiales bacterium]MCZ8098193.1 threonine ammonia-lyase [Burkholderiales bacterium]MCZ8339926.1 threonine ammonia-lyase [Burkholderiaceae bacterium]